MTDIITAISDTVVPLVGSVFDLMVSNPVLTFFLAVGVISAGVGVFTELRGAAK